MPPADVHTLFGNGETPGGLHHWNTLDRQDLFLEPDQIAGIAGETAVTADDTVAGDADRHRVIAQGLSHRPHSLGLADHLSDALIGHHCAIWHLSGGTQNLTLKVATH